MAQEVKISYEHKMDLLDKKAESYEDVMEQMNVLNKEEAKSFLDDVQRQFMHFDNPDYDENNESITEFDILKNFESYMSGRVFESWKDDFYKRKSIGQQEYDVETDLRGDYDEYWSVQSSVFVFYFLLF